MKKYNKFDWKQERSLVITEKHIYTFKAKSKFDFDLFNLLSKELRRKISIMQIAGLTVSKDPESSEMVVHVRMEHDLRLKSPK